MGPGGDLVYQTHGDGAGQARVVVGESGLPGTYVHSLQFFALHPLVLGDAFRLKDKQGQSALGRKNRHGAIGADGSALDQIHGVQVFAFFQDLHHLSHI